MLIIFITGLPLGLGSLIYANKPSPGRRPNAFLGFDWATLDCIDQVAEMLIETHPSLDSSILTWLLRSLHQDQDLERFLETIPGFYDSDIVKQPKEVFRPFHKDQVPRTILSFIHRTLSCATSLDETKQKRIRLSLQVMELDPYLLKRTFFHALSLPAKPTIFQCIGFVLVADRVARKPNGNRDVRFLAKCIIAVAISHVTAEELLDERWPRIVERWLSFPISRSDTSSDGQLVNMKLVNLVWLAKKLRFAGDEYRDKILHTTLDAASVVPVLGEGVVSESQNKFCVLWNLLLESAAAVPASESTANASLILPHIRTIYNTLHGGTDNTPVDQNLRPAHYQRCTDPTHPGNPHLTPGASSNVVAPASGDDPTATTPQDVTPVANDELPS